MTTKTTKNNHNQPEPMMTTQQVAAYLQVPVDTVYFWRHAEIEIGPLGKKIGKHVRWHRHEIDAFLARQAA